MISKIKPGLSALTLTFLAVVFCITSAMRTDKNSLEHALVANESFGKASKFEIDLYSGNAELKSAKEVLWITVASKDTEHLGDGHYKISGKNANDREVFGFVGSYKTKGSERRIKDGKFDLEINDDALNISYDLILTDGSQLKGEYKGKYGTADWR